MIVHSLKVSGFQPVSYQSTSQIPEKQACGRFCCNFPILVKQQNFADISYFLHFDFTGEIFCFSSRATPKKKGGGRKGPSFLKPF